VLGTYVSDALPLYSGVIIFLADEAKLLKSPDITLACVESCISFTTSLIHGPVAPKCYLNSGFINLFFDLVLYLLIVHLLDHLDMYLVLHKISNLIVY